jgi:hypothetical protein
MGNAKKKGKVIRWAKGLKNLVRFLTAFSTALEVTVRNDKLKNHDD